MLAPLGMVKNAGLFELLLSMQFKCEVEFKDLIDLWEGDGRGTKGVGPASIANNEVEARRLPDALLFIFEIVLSQKDGDMDPAG